MEKWESTTQQTSACPLNPGEGGIPSSWTGTQEECISQNKEQPGTVQSMYCKELVLRSDTEFSFEELRAQRYYKQLNEKVLHLNKVKEELKFQIEQKQKLIQGKNGAIQHQCQQLEKIAFRQPLDLNIDLRYIQIQQTEQLDVPQCSLQTADASCAPAVEVAPLKIYSDPGIPKNSAMRNNIKNHEDMGHIATGVKQASKSFAVFDENVVPEKLPERPNTRSSSMALTSLKLPTSILKSRQPASVSPNDKDASLSRSEEVILNAHWNKTLCRSPDDTCDFARAAHLASTPFGGPGRQNPSERAQMEEQEALNKSASVIFKEPNSEARVETNKLSPIQEISHEWGYTSLANTYPLALEGSQGRATAHSGIQPITETTVSAPALETKIVNPCSLDVRKALLDNVDLRSIATFIRKGGPLPDPDDLQFDGETLFVLKKLGEQGLYLYFSNGGRVIVKVDETTIPWDFYINSQLTARLPADLQHCHAQSTCYLFENGSFTLWQVPQGQTIQELIEDHVDRRDVPLLAIRLLEMVRRMHSCRLVHGALQPATLMVCHRYNDYFPSCEDSVICMDFSNSLDLELQTDVKTVQSFPLAEGYIKQGLLLPSASPYQVDLCGIADIVHLLLFGKNMKVIKDASYWRLAEDCGPRDWQRTLDLSNQFGSLWQDIFHNLLNPEDSTTEFILSNIINKINNTLSEGLDCQVSL